MSGTIETGLHEPDPEFARHLEWQVRTELRRTARFGEHPGTPAGHSMVADGAAEPRGPWRFARTAAIAICALALGAGSVVAAQQLERSREARLLTAGAEMRVRIAAARSEAAREECAALAERARSGFASEGELLECELRAARARAEVVRSELAASEVALTGREPSDRVSAPLVAGRDYVHERLAVDLDATGEVLAGLEQAASRDFALHQAGMLSDRELARRRLELRAVERERELVGRKLALRRQFVAGAIDAARADLEALRIAAEAKLRDARESAELAETNVARSASLAEAGLAPASAKEASERALEEARAAVALAALELGLIEERLGL